MIYLIGIIIFVFTQSWIDWEHLKDNDYIENHTSRLLSRALFVIVFSRLELYPLIGMSIFFAATFDNTLNLMRGKELFHLGKTASWDKFMRKIKPIYIALIISGIPISIFILLVL